MNTSNFSSASNDLTNGYANAMGLGDILVPVIGVTIILGLLVGLRNERFFGWCLDKFGAIATATYYAVHGVVATIVLGVLAAPFYLVATAERSTQVALGRYLLIGIAAFGALAALGYAWKQWIVDPIYENADEAGLIPETPDDADEVVE